MTKYEFPITVPASGGGNRINLAVAAIAAGAVIAGYSSLFSSTYLPCTKVSFVMALAAAGGVGFIGGATVDQAGTGADYILSAATATVPGGSREIDSQQDNNVLNLAQFYAHGAHPGDVILVAYYQA